MRRGQIVTLTLTIKLPVVAQPGTVTGDLQLFELEGRHEHREHIGRVDIAVTTHCPCLPPDPGKKGNITLEGIDSDGDGVRDDIQRYIAVTYPNSLPLRKALQQTAHLFGIALTQALDQSSARENFTALFRNFECLHAIDDKSAREVSVRLQAQFLNTIPRVRAYFAFSDLVGGQSIAVTPGAHQMDGCPQ
jgi:hypothetical protein